MAASVDSFNDLEELGVDCAANDSLTDSFNSAANHLQTLLPNVSNQKLLDLYGYYKQGMVGRCNVPKPSWYDMKAKSKWEAWNKLEDLSQNDAKLAYIEEVKSLDPEFDPSAKQSWVSVSVFENHEPKCKTITDYVKEENCAEVLKVLESGDVANVNQIDDQGLGLIHWAADRGSVEMLKTLIDFGADVNLQDTGGQTPLHYASSCGHVNCIKLLLASKARKDILDKDNASPLSVACDETVKELFNSC